MIEGNNGNGHTNDPKRRDSATGHGSGPGNGDGIREAHDGDERIYGTDEPDAELNDDTADDGSANSYSSGRRWIRNIIILLIVAGLIGNAVELWPRLFNAQTLSLLSVSKILSGNEEVARHMNAVVVVGTDKGKGSGFHVADGYIVTNYHVIKGAIQTVVVFPGLGESFAADVVDFDPDLDLAVLWVDSQGTELPSIEIEREHGWKPGERVYVIGNPLTLTQITVEGTVQGTMRIRDRQEPVLAVDAPIHEGNSGSPVINEHGRAIAVIYATSEITRDGKTEPIGLAVPLRDVQLLPQTPAQ